jgi:hypothetical protein
LIPERLSIDIENGRAKELQAKKSILKSNLILNINLQIIKSRLKD